MTKEQLKQRLEELQFLNRLDIRIGTIMGLLEYHEKYPVSMSGAKREEIDKHFKQIERTHSQLIENLSKNDNHICEQFEKCMKELEEREENNVKNQE